MSGSKQAVETLQEAIERALESARQNEKTFGEAELRALRRYSKTTRKLGLDNSNPLREMLVQAACAHAHNILWANLRPQPVHLDGLVNVMLALNYGDGYLVATKMRLCAYLALLAKLAKEPKIARTAAREAICQSKGLDNLTRGTMRLVLGEVNHRWSRGRSLRIALGIFKRESNELTLLMELAARQRLVEHYGGFGYFGQPFSLWHTWRNKDVTTRLVNNHSCEREVLQNAMLRRVPLALRCN